jgi:nitroimidazol reductase NimA-like FMN-containing flavoprotein (pyridoxamine 5'-phosphate oxidase superfamily)
MSFGVRGGLSGMPELVTSARAILDANLYMTLGTADADGRPWVSPVYYASEDFTNFYWVSRPGATHSRNLVERPRASVVVFDSRQPVNTGQAVYIAAVAEQVNGAELEHGVEVFSRSSLADGSGEFRLEDVTGDSALRLYRATASQWWMLDSHDQRVAVDPRR